MKESRESDRENERDGELCGFEVISPKYKHKQKSVKT